MYIKSYSCTRFAGLRDQEIEFDKGLNVILGPNEAGKSTIINGIYSTLFKDIKLTKNLNVDKDFTHRYMPRPEGDFIDGKLVIKIEENKYKLEKEWGVNEFIQLTTPDGNILKEEEKIQEILSKLLTYGEGTYSNIVFAKQKDLKDSLVNIMENNELTSEVNSILRKTMMELDGVSIEQLQKKIEDELDEVYKRWDKDKNRPMNNRGINNPYKIGLGEILKSYYKKEELLHLMDEAEKTEKNFEEICDEISEIEIKSNNLKQRKEDLEKIEEDINKRLVLEEELKFIERELEALMDANKEWPRSNLLLDQYKEKLLKVTEDKKKLSIEKENSRKLENKEKLEKKLKELEKISQEKDLVKKNLKEIPKITKENIDEIEKIQRKILTLDTTMTAGIMLGQLIKSTDENIWIKKDLKEKENLEPGQDFKANGLINIGYKDKFEIEIKTGEFDFKELKKDYDKLILDEKEKLSLLEIKTIEEGKLNLEKLSKLENDKINLENKRKLTLDGSSEEEIIEEIKNFEEIKTLRNICEIEKEIENLNKKELKLSVEIKTKKNQIEKWKEKYENEDKLLDILIEERSKEKTKTKELDRLVELPEEFVDGKEFQETLISVKRQFEENQDMLGTFREKYHEAKNQLLDISYEEIRRSYKDAKEKFNRSVKRGKTLLQVQKVFLKTKEKLDDNPMESLVNEFNRLLSIITSEKYKTANISDEFNIEIKSEKGEIPIDLLSAGTHDSVVLALRFSLLKHIFQDRKGYAILDDSLVDLDPRRREKSVELIQDFAKENQVIFTTCDPETAKMIGGNIIKL